MKPALPLLSDDERRVLGAALMVYSVELGALKRVSRRQAPRFESDRETVDALILRLRELAP